jgi:hypothetical protein
MRINKLIIPIILLLFFPNAYGQDSAADETYIFWGLTSGLWHPASGSSAMKNALMLGLNVEFLSNKDAFGINANLIMPHKMKQPVAYGTDPALNIDKCSSMQITFDYSRRLLKFGDYSIGAIAEIGYGEMIYTDSGQDKDKGKKTFIFAPGINTRYIIKERVSLQLKLQYCVSSYNLKNSHDPALKGNYLMLKFVLGGR